MTYTRNSSNLQTCDPKSREAPLLRLCSKETVELAQAQGELEGIKSGGTSFSKRQQTVPGASQVYPGRFFHLWKRAIRFSKARPLWEFP
jgi:hypothetical protein